MSAAVRHDKGRGDLQSHPEVRPTADRTRAVLAAAAFLVLACALSYRAVALRAVDGSASWVLGDFRNAVYYPVVAWLDGHNPYDVAHQLAAYPATTKFPLYSPLTLLIHLPFGLLPVHAAEVLYYAVALVLVPVLALVVLEACGVARTPARVFGLAALILASRPGHQNLLLGQVTLQVTIGSYLALRYAHDRPSVAGLGLAVSTLKPTFGAPLAFLMLCRGAWRATTIGMALGGLLASAVALSLVHAAGSVASLVDSVRGSWDVSMVSSSAHPALSVSRIDAVALVARLLGRSPGTAATLGIAVGLLGVGGLGIRRLARQGNAEGDLGIALICLSVLTCTYHQSYDLLLLTLPLTMLAVGTPSLDVSPPMRWTLCTLLGLPAANYLATEGVVARLGLTGGWWNAVTSVNGAAMLAAFALCTRAALRANR